MLSIYNQYICFNLGTRDNGTCENFGITPKESQHPGIGHSYVHRSVNLPFSTDSTEIVSLSDECCKLISAADILSILSKASSLYQIADVLRKMSSSSPAFNYKFLPLMSGTSAIIFSTGESDDVSQGCLKKLQDIVHGWGLKYIPMTGDGNCFFSSVAYR